MIDASFTSMRSLFVYGPDAEIVTVEMELPHRFVSDVDETMGGRRIASAGIGASFIVRRDQMWEVPLRFREEQWTDVLALIVWGQSEAALTWYPDADDLLVSYTVYLHAPEAGSMVKPTRNAEYPWMYELTVTLRRQLVEITGPAGYPTCDSIEAGGTFANAVVGNHNQDGDETLEIWLKQAITASGVVDEPTSGVFTGATDFSEFTEGAGIPSGITEYGAGSGGGGPTAYAIANDAGEGHYFTFSGHLSNQFGNPPPNYGVDAFDGAAGLNDIEMLARTWVAAQDVSGHNMIGPKCSMHSTPSFAAFGQDLYDRSPNHSTRCGNNSSGLGEGSMQEANQYGVWVWQRFQRIFAGGSSWDVRVKAWFGDLVDEPVAWDREDLGVTTSTAGPHTDEAIGFGFFGNNKNANPQRIAFLSFTTDPTAAAAPTPDDLTGGGEWVLVGTTAVSVSSTQTVTIEGLDSLSDYDVAFRYRRDGLYNAGASGNNPDIWPSVSRCSFSTTIDPPELLSTEWVRVSAGVEQITLTVTPADTTEDINVYRRTAIGSAALIGTISAPHVGDVTYDDDTIAGETAYWYSVSTQDTIESPPSDEIRVWSGPAGIPVYVYQITGHSAYWIGFTPGDATLPTELYDSYNNAGGNGAFNLRETGAAAETEIYSGILSGVPAGTFDLEAKLRHKQTSFAVDDYGEFCPQETISLPEEE